MFPPKNAVFFQYSGSNKAKVQQRVPQGCTQNHENCTHVRFPETSFSCLWHIPRNLVQFSDSLATFFVHVFHYRSKIRRNCVEFNERFVEFHQMSLNFGSIVEHMRKKRSKRVAELNQISFNSTKLR